MQGQNVVSNIFVRRIGNLFIELFILTNLAICVLHLAKNLQFFCSKLRQLDVKSVRYIG